MTKKTLTVMLVMMMLLVFEIGCFDPPKPVGEWISSGSREAVIFHKDGTFETLYFAYDRYPPPPNAPGYTEGTEIPGSGKWRLRDQGSYTVDFSKNPAWIDLIHNKQGTAVRNEGLIQFLDDNTFYLAVEDVRPASIDSSSRRSRWTRAAPNEIKR